MKPFKRVTRWWRSTIFPEKMRDLTFVILIPALVVLIVLLAMDGEFR